MAEQENKPSSERTSVTFKEVDPSRYPEIEEKLNNQKGESKGEPAIVKITDPRLVHLIIILATLCIASSITALLLAFKVFLG